MPFQFASAFLGTQLGRTTRASFTYLLYQYFVIDWRSNVKRTSK